MIKTSTNNDIIRFLYEETSLHEDGLIKQDILFNENTREEYYELDSVKRLLNKSFKIPHNRVIDNILNYSKSLNLRPVV